MTSVSRTFVTLITVIVFTLILGACLQIEVESDFRTDGSARHSIETSIDRTLLDDPMFTDELGGPLDLSRAQEQGEAAGYDVEVIDTAGRFGVRLSTDVDDNSDLGDVLSDLFAAVGNDSPPEGGFAGSFSESSSLGTTTYRFELTADGNRLFENEQDLFAGEADDELAPEVEEELGDEFGDEFDFDLEPGLDMFSQFMIITYTVSMPGEITEHNGSPAGPNRVQWEVPISGSETFFAESEEGSGFSLWVIVGIVLGVMALGLLIAGAYVLMRGQKAPEFKDKPAASDGPRT
jgi:hypothetical protein